MLRELRDAYLDTLPALNPVIAEGIAYHQAKDMLKECKEATESVFNSLGHDFTLVGVRVCTPYEAYNARAQKQPGGGSKMLVDIAETDQFTFKLEYEFKGDKAPPCYVNLPIIDRFNRFKNNDTISYVIPVLAGVPFSVERKRVFIALNRHRMNMAIGSEDYVKNGERCSSEVVFSLLHNGAKNTEVLDPDFTGKERTSLQLVIFGKYGFTGALERYCGVTPEIEVIGDKHYTSVECPEGYNTYTSIGRKMYYRSRKEVEITTCQLAVRIKEDETTAEVESFIAAFFHVIDLFPDMFIDVDFVNGVDQWRVAMAYILFRKEHSEGHALSKINAHYASLDHYLDLSQKRELARRGIVVEDFYDFCAEMCVRAPKILEGTSTTDMYNKRLVTLPYLLKGYIHAINEVSYAIVKARDRKENNGGVLVMNDVIKCFKDITQDVVMSSLSHSSHQEVINTDIPNDLPTVKITNQVLPQSKAKGTPQPNEDLIKNPAQRFDASIAEVGSMLFVTKGEGTGRNKLNLFVETNHKGDIKPREKFKFLINGLNFVIDRHVSKEFIRSLEERYHDELRREGFVD